MKFAGKVVNFGGNPDHRLDTGIVFLIRHCWEMQKVVSTDCASRRCKACTSRHRHSNYDVITSPAHDRRALAEVCTVPVLLVRTVPTYSLACFRPTYVVSINIAMFC